MNYEKYISLQHKRTEENLSGRLKNNDFDFFYNCINEFIENGNEEFVKAFTEFGLQFENRYNVSGIIQKIFYVRSENSIVEFNKISDTHHFKGLLDSYYWLNLAFVKSYQEKKELKGEFFQDTVLASLMAYCFYPQALEKTLEYLKAEYNESFKDKSEKKLPEQRKYNLYYGYSDIFQLLKELLSQEDKNYFQDMIHVPVENHYTFVINNYLNEDINVVNEVLEKLAQFHINNKGESYLDTFNHDCWKIFPLEMISILICRQRKGLSNEGINHPLIDGFLPYIFELEYLPNDEITKKLENKILKSK